MDLQSIAAIADLVQWVSFVITAFMYAWFAHKFLLVLWELIKDVLYHGSPEHRKSFLHFKLTLALTLTSLLAAEFVFAYLCSAALGVNDVFSLWKVDFNSSVLIFVLLSILSVALVVVQDQGCRAERISVLLGLGFFNALTVIYGLLYIGRGVKGTVVQPNDPVALVTLPVIVVLDIFAFQPNSGVAGAGGKQEIVDAV